MERDVPTTQYPAPRNAATRPAPMPCEAPVMIATLCDAEAVTPDSPDEVGLVDDTPGLPAAHADEDALVQPIEIGSGGLDLC